MAHIQQNIKFFDNDLSKGLIDIKNSFFFRDLSNYKLNWEVIANGEVVESGTINDLDYAPQTKKAIKIPFKTSFEKGDEYFLNVSAVLKTKEPLLPAGYEVAYEQFQLQEGTLQLPEPATAAVTSKTKGDVITVTGTNFELKYDRKTGTLTDYTFNGEDLLMSGPQVNFWRAPTDNDYGAGTPTRYKEWKDAATSGEVTTAVKQVSKPEVEIRLPGIYLKGMPK